MSAKLLTFYVGANNGPSWPSRSEDPEKRQDPVYIEHPIAQTLVGEKRYYGGQRATKIERDCGHFHQLDHRERQYIVIFNNAFFFSGRLGSCFPKGPSSVD
jgi:hypothetical protein